MHSTYSAQHRGRKKGTVKIPSVEDEAGEMVVEEEEREVGEKEEKEEEREVGEKVEREAREGALR